VAGTIYPDGHETVAILPSGASTRIRPLRPADASLLMEFAARITPEDLRLRFFAVLPGISPEMAPTLTRVDFTSDMALIAERLDKEEILGVARYMSDAVAQEAEFAVLLRSDCKGQGIGWKLMQRLVEAAREQCIKRLTGWVLVENTNMIKFCRELGFSIRRNPDDPLTVVASLSLV